MSEGGGGGAKPKRPRRWRRIFLALVVLLGIGLGFARSSVYVLLHSLNLLAGIASNGGSGLPLLGPLISYDVDQSREQTTLAGGEVLEMDVYRPRGPGPWPALLLVSGFNKEGTRDPRIVMLARLSSRAGAVVVVPDLPEVFRYRFSSRVAERVEAAFGFMAARPEVRPERLSVFGASVSGGFALAAATRPAVASRVHCFFAFAPFHDYGHLIEFVLTGRYHHEGKTRHLRPSPFSRWIVLYNYLDLARDPSDPDFETMREVIRLRIYEEWDAADELEKTLSREGRAHLDALEDLEGGDLEILQPLVRKIIETEAEESQVLSPHVNLCEIHGQLFVIHGREDDIIPFSESVALAEHSRECPEQRCELLLTQLYTHAVVESRFQGLWHKIRYEVPEMLRYFLFLNRALRCLLV